MPQVNQPVLVLGNTRPLLHRQHNLKIQLHQPHRTYTSIRRTTTILQHTLLDLSLFSSFSILVSSSLGIGASAKKLVILCSNHQHTQGSRLQG
ncbi:hypothetical protein VTL71DRAFT_9996, partial [Oculimacula yallundae]